MSSLTVRPSTGAARRDAVEAQVLTAVEELLGAGESYVELSVASIADRAGVARSTFVRPLRGQDRAAHPAGVDQDR